LFRQTQYEEVVVNKNVIVKKSVIFAKYHLPYFRKPSYLARICTYTLHFLMVLVHHGTQFSIGAESRPGRL